MKWSWTPSSEQAESLSHLRGDRAIIDAYRVDWGQIEGDGDRPLLSRTFLHQLADDQKVHIDQSPLDAKSLGKLRIQSPMCIEILFGRPRPLEVLAENLPLEILYEDEHLLVVNKPQGMSTHPSDSESSGTLVNALLFHVKHLSGIGGVARPGIVHRLDKNTSGSLVVAKSDVAHQGLVALFARHDLERRYWALCYGTLPRPGPYKVENQIGRNPTDRKKMAILKTGGKTAITQLTVLQNFGAARQPHSSFVEARLETGRTHQVRVHLTSQGASVMGDTLYGTPTETQSKFKNLPNAAQNQIRHLPGQALHARILAFEHPVTQKSLSIEAEPPETFLALAKALGGQ